MSEQRTVQEEIRNGIEVIFQKYKESLQKDPAIDFRNFASRDVMNYLLQKQKLRSLLLELGQPIIIPADEQKQPETASDKPPRDIIVTTYFEGE